MKKLTDNEKSLYEIVCRGNVWTTGELADELGVSKSRVRLLIRKLRKKFLDNYPEVSAYIFTTKGGYTIDERPENVIYEARLRMAMGTGVLFNGVYVFRRGKKIAEKNFGELKIEYKPKLLEVEKVI